MGGNAGIRGYLIQTIIGVLDSLEADNSWISITLEPNEESEKVDIKWVYLNNVTKVCQVKSSQNIFKYSAAKKWASELESKSPNATKYQLILVGHPEEKLLNNNKIGTVEIVTGKSINADELIAIASTKIDSYYERKLKPKISSKVREILVKTLSLHFATNSIVGKEIRRDEFDNALLDWINAIEKQIDINPFLSLSQPIENEVVPINHRLANKIIELIGWTKFSEYIKVEMPNEHTQQTDEHIIDFYGNFESKLIEDTEDVILITSYHDLTYPHSSKVGISKYLYDTKVVFDDLQRKNAFPRGKNNYNYHSILFWLTTDNSELQKEFVYQVRENYKRDLLSDQINYYFFDNHNANFLISAMVAAKNYREDLVVKFLYPITENNQKPNSIGQRGTKLPVQYINSSVIPIIKESASTISILLFCSDPFSEDSLKKIIWLTIKLTSGLGNEYRIYFPDYESHLHKNVASEIIRSYNDDVLQEKIKIEKYNSISAESLDTIDASQVQVVKNENYNELTEQNVVKSKHLNEIFLTILPYGDTLRPFLKTDGITSNDLKIFLGKKGIFVRNADKDKLVKLMSTLLFSPKELEDFKMLIDIKERPLNTTNEIFRIKENDSLDNVFKKLAINYDNITEGTSTKLLDTPSFKKNLSNPAEYILDVRTEQKNPTDHISVNTHWGRVEIVCKKEGENLVVNQINSISKDDRTIANRVIKLVEDEFKRIDFVAEETVRVMFSSFKSNVDRIHFLLSYMNVASSHLLKEADIKTIKFTFDDKEEIPEAFKDKKDKDLITYFSGRNLSGLNEITDEGLKKVVLLEEVNISYKFDYLNAKNATYSVRFNFSDALKNKPVKDGIFKSVPNLEKSTSIKKLNVKNIERDLSKEVERIKLEKLKKFDFM